MLCDTRCGLKSRISDCIFHGHQRSNIFLVDEKGKLEPLNLTQQKDLGQRNGHPTWSLDGTQIAFDTNRKGKANYEIFLMDVDGANPKNLSKSDEDDKEPAWSRKEIRFFSSLNAMATWKSTL